MERINSFMKYLIDFENVASSGLNGLEKLTGEDEVIIFYSENRSTITISAHRKLENSEVKKDYLQIKTGGKNALDFQLVSWLGYLIAQSDAKKERFCIVSNDSGFDAVVDFWKKRDVNVMRSSDLNGVQVVKVTERIKELLPQYKEEAGHIQNVINRYKTKQGINNALVKLYGSEKAGTIYKSIKPLLTGKKGK